MNPLRGVGMLFEDLNGHLTFLGTCFAFRHRNYFLCADHCVRDRQHNSLAIANPTNAVFTGVEAVISHTRADIAVLKLANDGPETIEPFWGFVTNYGLGEEFMTYGFPEDSRGPNLGDPTARLFRGYYQRYMEHQSHMKYNYVAGELNIACPGGLSGGPLFRPGAPQMLTGIVTENLEATTLLDSEERILEGGVQHHDHYRRVINYGVAIMLDRVGNWIDENVPPRNT